MTASNNGGDDQAAKADAPAQTYTIEALSPGEACVLLSLFKQGAKTIGNPADPASLYAGLHLIAAHEEQYTSLREKLLRLDAWHNAVLDARREAKPEPIAAAFESFITRFQKKS